LLAFVLLVLSLVLIRRSALSKGKRGEYKVNTGLSRLLDRKIYRLVEDVILPFGNDTTQIDHLVVSPYGIFVIETKNISGWIFGQPDHAQWTQVIYRSKHRFQNPLLQNKLHVRVVGDLLNLTPDRVHNVVVFVGRCSFKTPMPANVVHGVRELAALIEAHRIPVFTENEIRLFLDIIQTNRLAPGRQTDRAHVRNVRRRISDSTAGSRITCPNCGGAMVERIGRRTGEHFLGCQRFPQCRGMRSLPISGVS
jgi:restriction system protein